MAELGDVDVPGLLERRCRLVGRPRPHGGAAAPGRRPGRGPRRHRGVRGARLGAARQPGRAGLGRRGPRGPPGGHAGRRHLPHAGARRHGRRLAGDPRGPDRVPPGRRRAAARHEPAGVEPAPPVLPGRGHARRHRGRRRHARGRVPRSAVAGGVQRRRAGGRPGRDRAGGDAVAGVPRGPGGWRARGGGPAAVPRGTARSAPRARAAYRRRLRGDRRRASAARGPRLRVGRAAPHQARDVVAQR